MSLPENFVAQDVLPQLELLQKCHAFITHGGANSMHEALSFGISVAPRQCCEIISCRPFDIIRHPFDKPRFEALANYRWP